MTDRDYTKFQDAYNRHFPTIIFLFMALIVTVVLMTPFAFASLNSATSQHDFSVATPTTSISSPMTVEATIHLCGDTEWYQKVTAVEDGTYRVQLLYHNTSGERQDGVIAKLDLPSNVTFVPGSTKVYTTTYPEGLCIEHDDLIGTGLAVGNFKPGGNVYVRCKVTLAVPIDEAETIWANFTAGGHTGSTYCTIVPAA